MVEVDFVAEAVVPVAVGALLLELAAPRQEDQCIDTDHNPRRLHRTEHSESAEAQEVEEARHEERRSKNGWGHDAVAAGVQHVEQTVVEAAGHVVQ